HAFTEPDIVCPLRRGGGCPCRHCPEPLIETPWTGPDKGFRGIGSLPAYGNARRGRTPAGPARAPAEFHRTRRAPSRCALRGPSGGGALLFPVGRGLRHLLVAPPENEEAEEEGRD